MQRLPYDANTEAEVFQYYTTRARQLWHEGFRWEQSLEKVGDYGFLTYFRKDGSRYASAYVLNDFRGKGLIKDLLALPKEPFVTVTDCHVASVFEHCQVPYVLAGPWLDSVEYGLVQTFYGDGRARRSGAYLMNHIDEGLAILRQIGATEQAARAYCLHPLLQDDEPLQQNYGRVAQALASLPDGAHVLGLAIEYRSVANEYLSAKAMPEAGLRLSALKEVNDMLVADKVQNRKDFEKFHLGTHPRSERLVCYFGEWLEALGVADQYTRLVADLPSF